MSVKVKNNLRKSQAQFREKLRKLRLRQSDDFLIKKRGIPKFFLIFSYSEPYCSGNFILRQQGVYNIHYYRHAGINCTTRFETDS